MPSCAIHRISLQLPSGDPIVHPPVERFAKLRTGRLSGTSAAAARSPQTPSSAAKPAPAAEGAAAPVRLGEGSVLF